MSNLSKSILSGQNASWPGSGVRSSRTSSTNFKQLRKLDREIAKLTPQIACEEMRCRLGGSNQLSKLKDRWGRLDQKRKMTREKRKGYCI